jgi:DNA-binding IclR family transcriptional regulator
MLTYQKVCNEYLILKALKKYPDGVTAQKLAQDTQLPLTEVKNLILQLCVLGWFAIGK